MDLRPPFADQARVSGRRLVAALQAAGMPDVRREEER
jgi:hypothetical protein